MHYILTGATRGIGYATLLALAQQPEHRIVALVRQPATLAAIQEAYPNIKAIAIDLAAPKTNFVPALEQAMRFLDHKVGVLINNAATLCNKNFLDLQPEDIAESFAINFNSIVYLIQILQPYFTTPSHIVNIGSMGGFQGSQRFGGLSLYTATKAALGNLSESLAVELEQYDIKVNCLALGAVQTDMLQAAFPDYNTEQTPQKMAQFIADFATKGHQFFNGKIIPVSTQTP